jgi:hypothetical protein
MSPDNTIKPIPQLWRGIFSIEIPLVVFALGSWLFQPETYLRYTIGITAPGEAEIFLLRLYAGTIASLVFGFYAWLLLQPAVHMPTFRAFQVCLAAGDVFIIAASLAFWSANQRHDTLLLQMGMAALWGIVRVVFLLTTR